MEPELNQRIKVRIEKAVVPTMILLLINPFFHHSMRVGHC